MPETMIGGYGPWAAGMVPDGPAKLSLRSGRWTDVEAWRTLACARVLERTAQPPTGGTREATVHRASEYEGLGEELSGQLPYGPHKLDISMQAEAFAWFDRWLKG